jgi:predicted AAA+ superfamily ATPase
MEELLLKSNRKIEQTTLDFSRYLFGKIDFGNRLIAIKGARGSGKTTLLLQYGKRLKESKAHVLYISMDDLYFMSHNLLELANQFSTYGGTHLLIDEVHKYPNWSREIKLIYDDLPDLKLIFTSSSILEIYKGESDLSRRVVNYNLKELSFREFVALKTSIHLPTLTLDEIFYKHEEACYDFLKVIRPIPLFNEYLKLGAYPYFTENQDLYHEKLRQTIELILEVDLSIIENMDYQQIYKFKKLLYIISKSVPFTPNISKLSEQIGVSRPTLLLGLNMLEKAGLILQLSKVDKGIGILTKPDKIFLSNPNIAYALAPENTEIGNSRETFIASQLTGNVTFHLSEKTDFILEKKYALEIGGKNKGFTQLVGQENAFVVKDGIEIGTNHIIPLWLFGFLY